MKPGDHKYVYEKARSYCAYQERCVWEVKNKLFEWKVRPEVAQKIINTLVEENYLNEERFARVFAGGKFRIKKWGRNKIMSELRARRLPELIVQIGLEEIDEYDYIKTLNALIDKKKVEFDDPTETKNRNKIYKFLLSRGFESHLILKHIKS